MENNSLVYLLLLMVGTKACSEIFVAKLEEICKSLLISQSNLRGDYLLSLKGITLFNIPFIICSLWHANCLLLKFCLIYYKLMLMTNAWSLEADWFIKLSHTCTIGKRNTFWKKNPLEVTCILCPRHPAKWMFRKQLDYIQVTRGVVVRTFIFRWILVVKAFLLIFNKKNFLY